MSGMGRILVAEDKDSVREMLVMALQSAGYDVAESADGGAALTRLEAEPYDLVLSDLRMPVMDGMELLKRTRQLRSPPAFIMVTAHGSIREAVAAKNLGAVDFIEKPFDLEELEYKVAEAIGSHAPIGSGVAPLDGVIGGSPQMLEAADMVRRLADASLPVLFAGETGSGRRTLAHALHLAGCRADKPFLAVSCAAPDNGNADAEIFGAEKGALPGHPDGVSGKIEAAAQGTLVLEDVESLPSSAQHRLLRCIQEKAVERFGGNRAVPCEARLLLTTRANLHEQVRQGKFREDLFYRIQGVTVTVPPLRERREDIPALARHFLAKSAGTGRRTPTLSPRAETILREYRWPGNVAELQSVIERCAAIANGDMITEAELPANIRQAVAGGGESGLAGEVESLERQMILDALTKHNWNQTHAAAALKMNRTSLQYKMQKHRLSKPGK